MMSKLVFLVYISVLFYIWLSAIVELFTGKEHDFFAFAGKIVIAPFWFILIFSESGRNYLFNFVKNSNL